MAKRRRKKNKPNIPQATLERARQQAGLDPSEEVEDQPQTEAVQADDLDDSPKSEPEAVATPSKPERPRRRRSKVSPAQLDKAKKRGELDQQMMNEMLINPTVEVSEEQLHQEYAYVLKDLRNMGVLAAALLVLLVVLAQFI